MERTDSGFSSLPDLYDLDCGKTMASDLEIYQSQTLWPTDRSLTTG